MIFNLLQKNVVRIVIFIAIIAILVLLPLGVYAGSPPSSSTTAGDVLTTIGSAVLIPIVELMRGMVYLLFLVAAAILAMVGYLVDFVVVQFVLEMGKYITGTDSGVVNGIYVAWRIVRDMANIGIIAGLIAVSIGTIIQSSSLSAEKLLGRLIVAALLVNFSYFIAGVVIDASNFTATVIYNNITAPEGSCGVLGRIGASTDNSEKCHLSGRIMRGAEWTTWSNLDPNQNRSWWQYVSSGAVLGDLDPSTWAGKSARALAYDIGKLVMIFVALHAFISIVGLLVARFVALVFILVTSPIGIAGMAVPKLDSFAKEWWEALWSQALFAPVFFLLIGLGMSVHEQIVPIFYQSANSATEGVGVAATRIFISFMLAIAMIHISIRVAKQMSEKAKRFSDIYKAADNYITKPLGGFITRNTLGRAGEYLGIQYNNRLAPALRTWLPFGIGDALDRNINSTIAGLRTTKPFGEQNFDEVKKERIKRDIETTARKKEMGKRKDAKLAVNNLDKAQKDYDEKFKYENLRQKRNGTQKRDANGNLLYLDEDGNETTVAEGPDGRKRSIAGQELYLTNDGGLTTGAKDADGKDHRKAMESMMDLQVRLEKETGLREARTNAQTALADLPPGAIERWFEEEPHLLEKYARALSTEQYMKAMESTAISTSQKKRMREKRHGHYMKLVRELNADVESGRVLEDGEEYGDRIGQIFEYAKKTVRSKEEFLDLIVSDTGKDMRGMRTLWHGSTNGMYVEAQKSTKIGEAEKRERRALKRKSYLRHLQSWSGAEMIKGRGSELPYHPEDNMDAQAEARKWAENTIAHADKVIANATNSADRKEAENRKKFAGFILSGARYEDLSEADKALVDKMQGRSEDGMAGWFQGKADNEVGSEVQDRQLYHPLFAKNISTGQLMAIDQDQRFLDAVRDNVLTDGDESVIRLIATSSDLQKKYGWPSPEDEKKIDEKRRMLAIRRGEKTYRTLADIVTGDPSKTHPVNPT